MENPRGRIEAIFSDRQGVRATVGVDAALVCARCAAGKGCGAAIFSDTAQQRRVTATVPAGLDLAEGDRVEIELAPDNILRAALIVYGMPMVGAIAGAALAYGLQFGDAVAAAAALAGLVLGLMVGRYQLRRNDCLSRFVPTITRRLDEPQAVG